MIHIVVEVDVKNKFTYGNDLAARHIKELTHALSQIPRVVEFLQSGETKIWGDLRMVGWEWNPDQDYGLCWHFLGDYVGVTVEG